VSYGLLALIGWPLSARPNRQFTCRRQLSILPAGCASALIVTDAAPTPCRRTGFHINRFSL
jgi:hypothetical protein